MQEIALRTTVMEDQLKTAREATSRLDNLKQQVKVLVDVQRAPPPLQPSHSDLPAKPRSWAATAAARLKVVSDKAPAAPPSNQVINAFRPSQVIIRNQEGKKPFKGIKAAEIVKQVNEALTQLEVKV